MKRIALQQTAKSQRDLSASILKAVLGNAALKKAFPLPVEPKVTLEGNVSFYFSIPPDKVSGLTLDPALKDSLEAVAQKGGTLGQYLEADGVAVILLQSRFVSLSGGKPGWVLTYSPKELKA